MIREEQPDDVPGIRKTVGAAFPKPLEATAVDQLRADGDSIISLVAIEAGEVIGHAMLSRMSAPFKALALGPVAIAPDKQRQGVGSQLIQEAIARATKDGWQAVFVLGSRAYYQRFGFDPAQATGFSSPYAGPYFMALPLNGALPVRHGKVEYAKAFASLS